MFREQLEGILEGCHGAVAGVVMGFDGIAVDALTRDSLQGENGSPVDVQTVSMEFSFVLTQVRKAADLLEVGRLKEVAIRSDDLTFIVRVLSKEYFLGIALRPDGNFGKGRFLMRLAAPKLQAQL